MYNLHWIYFNIAQGLEYSGQQKLTPMIKYVEQQMNEVVSSKAEEKQSASETEELSGKGGRDQTHEELWVSIVLNLIFSMSQLALTFNRNDVGTNVIMIYVHVVLYVQPYIASPCNVIC